MPNSTSSARSSITCRSSGTTTTTGFEATLAESAELLGRDDGLEEGLQSIKEALPKKLWETAYALACDVVAADGEATQEELRILELLRHRLGIDRLVATAIERAARARFMTV